MSASDNVTSGAISPAQSRGARAMLNWSLDDLAAKSGIAKRTIIRFEGSSGETRSTSLTAIRAALEAAGVEFIEENGGGAGVRLLGRDQ